MRTLSHQLHLYTSHDLWDWVGAACGAILFFVAIVGGLIALKSFISGQEASAHAHMHAMFGRYLEKRDEFSKTRQNALGEILKSPASLQEDADFGGSALYYLEEVFAWTQQSSRQMTRWSRFFIYSLDERALRRDIVRSWESTVKTQLITNVANVIPSLLGYTSCYGSDFLSFAASNLNKPELTAQEKVNAIAVSRGSGRPLGYAEIFQLHSIDAEAVAADRLEWACEMRLKYSPGETLALASASAHPAGP